MKLDEGAQARQGDSHFTSLAEDFLRNLSSTAHGKEELT